MDRTFYSVLISAPGQRKGNASMRCTEEHSVRECAEKGAVGSNEDRGNKKELLEAVGELTREKTVPTITWRGPRSGLREEDGICRRFISGRKQSVGWRP